MSAASGEAGEADRIDGTPHPRGTLSFIGNSDNEHALLAAYRANRLPHAIIVGGQAGIGKATLAWRLARFLLVNPAHESRSVVEARDLAVPPGAKAAAEVASLSHPDVCLLRCEVNERSRRFFTEIRADDVRRAIALFQRGAAAGGYRICIIDSAEDLNRSSANALLKMIEEPPPRSLFLLVAHRPGLILPTLRSRARLLRLGALDAGEIERVVRSLGPPWSELPDAEVAAAAAGAQGSVHDALRRLGHRGGTDLDRAVRGLLDRLPAVDWREVHRLAEQAAGRNGDAALESMLHAVYDWLDATLRRRAAQHPPARLAALAEAWDRIAAQARETEALNLDKRPLLIAAFTELAAAARAR